MNLDELKKLREHIDSAIWLSESGCMQNMSEKEALEYKQQFGNHDFIVGDFGITKINRVKPPQNQTQSDRGFIADQSDIKFQLKQD